MTDELLKLYFEPSSRCNLACTMCFHNSWIGESLSDMDTQVFDHAIDTMPESVGTVFFGGMGEPLIHESILYMVKRAAEKGVRVELLTNGTLLTREMSASLLEAGLNMLWVSLDSIDADEYEQIRQKSSFSLVRQNILDYNTERRKRENTVEWIVGRTPAALGIAFVAMKSNIRKLGELNRFAFEHGVNDINITNISPTDRESQEESLCTRILSLGLGADGSGHPRISMPLMDARIDAVMEGVSDLLSTDFSFVPVGSGITARRRRYCKFIGDGVAFIRHDGEVSPCMALLHSSETYLDNKKRVVWHHSFGNAGQKSLSDIWNSEEYAQFRSTVRDFQFSPCTQCGGCDFRDENKEDCFGNKKPTCGACLWSEGVLSCP